MPPSFFNDEDAVVTSSVGAAEMPPPYSDGVMPSLLPYAMACPRFVKISVSIWS